MTCENNADSNPKIQFIHRSVVGPVNVIYRELTIEDSRKAERLEKLAFPMEKDRNNWDFLLQTPEIRYILGVFDLHDNLLGCIYMNRNAGVTLVNNRMDKVTRNLIRDKFCSYISFVAVLEEYRRYGLASELLRRTIEESKESGYELIYLHTEQNNQSATSSYEKVGFTNEAVLENYYPTGSSDRENAVLYVMRLDENTESRNDSPCEEPENTIQEKFKTFETGSRETSETHPDQ